MQLSQDERKQCEELLVKISEAVEETKENYKQLMLRKALLEELLRDGGEELKQEVKDTLGSTNNEYICDTQ